MWFITPLASVVVPLCDLKTSLFLHCFEIEPNFCSKKKVWEKSKLGSKGKCAILEARKFSLETRNILSKTGKYLPLLSKIKIFWFFPQNYFCEKTVIFLFLHFMVFNNKITIIFKNKKFMLFSAKFIMPK